MQRKHLGVVLALAVALIGGPTTMATAQPLAPVTSVKLSTVMATPAGVTGSQLKAAPAARAKVYNFTKAFTTLKATTGKGAASVVSIHRQTKVEVLSKKGSWTKVRVSGKTGFLPTSVLGKTKPTTVSRWVKGKQPVYQNFKSSSKKLGTLANNTKITWLRNSGSWQQVRTSAGIGWMPSSKLSNSTIKPQAKPKVYSYTKSFTTVKAKAYRSSANLISVHRQTKVEVLQNKGSWTKVRVSGKVGFVPTSALSKKSPATVSRWVKGKQPVYVSAKTSSRKLGTLANNTKITWLRNSGSWQQVRTSAGIGWMPSSKLSNSTIKPQAEPKVYSYTKSFTMVKAKAYGSSSNLISVLRQTKVEVLQNKGSWTKVRVSGKVGFVPTSALSKKSPATVSRWVKGKQPVYVSAKTSSRKLGTLANNTKITWLRKSGSWQQVRTSAGIGWMPSATLSTKPIAPQAKPKVYNYTKTYTTVKAKAYRSSANLTSVQRQTKVEVLQNKGSWTKVRVSGKVGFVPTSALSKTSPATVSRWVKGKQPVYVSAKTSSRKLSTLSNNTKITWLRTSGSWQQVRTSAGIGWMRSTALSTKVIPVAPSKPPVKFNAPRWTTENVNLRTGPGTSNRSLGAVPKGERVLLASSVNGWGNVKTSRGTGWISTTYLSTVAPTQKPPTPDAIKFDSPRWTTTNLNLRKGAGTNHEALGVVPMGERVLRGRSSNGWANVKTSKGIGWVSEIYLATTAPPPKPTTQYRWATGNVNLRAGGSTIYPIMGVVQAGDRVTYLGSRNGWANVVTNLGTGWMSEAYLSKKQVAKLQPDTIAVNNAVKAHFGSWVTSYGGVRPGSVGHSSGRATDLMIKDYKSPQSIKNGDKIADFLIANRKSLGISYLIWQDKIWLGAGTGWQEYSKSGKYGNQFVGNWNDTTLHLDHIHAETIGNAGTGAPLIK